MINDLAISNDQFDGGMMKYANDTNVSEYIVEIHIEEISSSLINQNVKRLLCLLKGITKLPYQKYKGLQIERVEKLSIFGLSIKRDLKWDDHVDKIVCKASKRIYMLKQLKRFGLNAGDLKCFYVAAKRSILDYSCQVFHYGLPCRVPAGRIERIQSINSIHCVFVIYLRLSYQDALDTLGLQTQYSRRFDLYNKLFDSIFSDEEHKLRILLPPKVKFNTYTYNFRSNKLLYM